MFKGDSVEQVIGEPLLEQKIKDGMDQANQKSVSSAQQIKKWLVIPNGFSVETGELTPTMKLKRMIIHQKYETQIEELYNV